MSARLRSVLLGIALGVVPLLLLDLATTLAGVDDRATAWWTIAAYALIGASVAATVLRARRDPLIPGVAALVLLVAVAPGLPAPLDRLPVLPVVGDVAVTQMPVIVVLAAVCAVGAIRGGTR